MNFNSRQSGIATLFVSSIILFAMIMMVLVVTKSAIIEQKIHANSARKTLARYHAESGINQHLSELNQPDSPLLSEQEIPEIADFFAYSDDKSRFYSLSAQLNRLPVHGNNDAKIITFPLICKGDFFAGNNWTIHNTSFNQSLWCGGKITIENSFNFKSFGVSNSLPLSSSSSSGIDVFAQDIALKNFSSDVFFENFINESKNVVKNIAKHQDNFLGHNDSDELSSKSGLIWLGDGNKDIILSNLSLGTKDQPVMLFIDVSNASLTLRSKNHIQGLLYIIGNWSSVGETLIEGGVIIEGNVLKSHSPELSQTTIHYLPERLQFNLTPDGVLAQSIQLQAFTYKDDNE